MNEKVQRRTVDLSAYPDLVVIYLGMRFAPIVEATGSMFTARSRAGRHGV